MGFIGSFNRIYLRMEILKEKVAVCIVSLLIIAIMGGCNQDNHKHKLKENKLIHFDISTWQKNKTFPDSLIKRIEFLPLESTDDCLIGNIDKLLVGKENLYVLDMKYGKKVFIFDRKGRFIKSIGNYGKGPGGKPWHR